MSEERRLNLVLAQLKDDSPETSGEAVIELLTLNEIIDAKRGREG